MTELSDQYKDARNLNAIQVTQTGKSKTLQKKPESNVKSKRTEPKDKNKRFVQRNKRECHKCNKFGHISQECRSKHVVNSVAQNNQEKAQPTCFVSTVPTDSFVGSMGHRQH